MDTPATLQETAAIHYWNRKEARQEEEAVYGENWIRWIYGTFPGQKLADHLLSRKFLSQLYGKYQSSQLSQHKIAPFIQEFKIPMEEFEKQTYQNFNEFFIRKFKPEARTFTAISQEFPAFCEARYLAYEQVHETQTFPVKGQYLSPAALLGDVTRARPFEGGPLLLARLCPTDYHRFHFPDEGRILETYSIPGSLQSVNPLALKYKNEIFVTNERQVSIIETKNFGKLAYIEVGALCVGKIVQTHTASSFKRGEEKGYFLFGGSTVIVLGEKGMWKPDADLLQKTQQNQETLVQLGERIGSR